LNVKADHPVGTCEQVLGRGRAPRLSIGTLQLSIRCSSIHFRPSRSLPVSDAGMLAGAIWSGRASCADVDDVKLMTRSAPDIPPHKNRMTASQTSPLNRVPTGLFD
jgi:hypothetical protein